MSNLVQEKMFWSKLKLARAKLLPFWYISLPYSLELIHCVLGYVLFLLLLDCIAKHKQLPAIEAVVKGMAGNTNQRVSPIFVLILCPTRELASQIAAETNVLLKYHEGIGMQTLVGGTRFKEDQKRLESNPCQVCTSLLAIEFSALLSVVVERVKAIIQSFCR